MKWNIPLPQIYSVKFIVLILDRMMSREKVSEFELLLEMLFVWIYLKMIVLYFLALGKNEVENNRM